MNDLKSILEDVSHYSSRAIDYILVNYRQDRRRRLLQALAVVALTGLPVIPELCTLITDSLGLSPKNHSIRTAFSVDLPASGLAISETPQFIGPSRLGLIRLTDVGRKACADLGLEVTLSEWERLIRDHNGLQFPRHTLGVLAFAYQARRRGWEVQLLPRTGMPVEPDLQVSMNGKDSLYVEFETRARSHKKKWAKISRWTRSVGVATFSSAMRNVLVEECQDFSLRGKAADLETLSQEGKGGRALGDLWKERWGRW